MTPGDLFIDTGPHAAWFRNEPLTLTRQEFDLLLSLARAADRVKTRACWWRSPSAISKP